MTSKRIMFTNQAGEVVLLTPAEPMLDQEPEGQYLDRVALRAVNACPWLKTWTRQANVEVSNLPSRRWRNAWQFANGTISVNLTRARLLRRGELRERRKLLLNLLSQAIDQAEDDGNSGTAVNLRGKRRALRDCDLDAKLSQVSDLNTLSTYEPGEFQGID
jgi:hypothetical protein